MNKKEITRDNNIKGERKSKKNFLKLFTKENKNRKKLRLIKNVSPNLQFQWKNCEINNTILDLQLFSYKLLEAKHNSTPEQYSRIVYNILIKKKKCHLFAYFKEMAIYTNSLKDNLRRYYAYRETKERIPKYVSSRKNYLLYFCRPFYTNYEINRLMVMHKEKVAPIFYNNNYAEEKEEKDQKNKKENTFDFQIFNKRISEEIENFNICTFVFLDGCIKKIKKNKNEKFIDLNKEEPSTINGNSNVITITQRYSNEERVMNQKKRIGKDNNSSNNQMIVPQNNNSISLLINELENRDNNPKENKEINNNHIIPNKSKNNDNNCIIIQGGKTTNNINININYLTIGHKLLSPKGDCKKIVNGITPINNRLIRKEIYDSNNAHKIIAKIAKKENTNNFFIKLKQISSKKINNYLESTPQKNIKDTKKSKNSTLTLPPPIKNMLQNKKYIKICPSPIKNNNYKQINNYIKTRDNPLKEARNKYVFRGGYNGGSKTNSLKYKNVSISENKKITIYTNDTNNNNYIQNLKICESTKINNDINNINNSKNILILSDRGKKSASNMHKKQKKIFGSIMKINDRNIQYLKIKKNKIENNKAFSPLIKREPIYNKLNNRNYKIKELKLKKRDLNLNKFSNIPHKVIRAKSTGK